MSKSSWGEVRGSTIPIVLVALIVAWFFISASFHRHLDNMERRLLDRLDRVGQQLSDRTARPGSVRGDQ